MEFVRSGNEWDWRGKLVKFWQWFWGIRRGNWKENLSCHLIRRKSWLREIKEVCRSWLDWNLIEDCITENLKQNFCLFSKLKRWIDALWKTWTCVGWINQRSSFRLFKFNFHCTLPFVSSSPMELQVIQNQFHYPLTPSACILPHHHNCHSIP
jgi:hypothetical protein